MKERIDRKIKKFRRIQDSRKDSLGRQMEQSGLKKQTVIARLRKEICRASEGGMLLSAIACVLSSLTVFCRLHCRRVLAFLLSFVLLFSSVPAFALVVGSKGGEDRVLETVRFTLIHEGFDFSGGYIELKGENLQGIEVYQRIGSQLENIGERKIDTYSRVTITLSKEDMVSFSGELAVGNQDIDLETGNFPNIQGANKNSVIEDATPADSITFIGTNLGAISNTNTTGNIYGHYGAGTNHGGNLRGANSSISPDGKELTLTSPEAPGRKGEQDIYIERTKVYGSGTADEYTTIVKYEYHSAFRILEDMGIEDNDLSMYPNTGSKGDTFYIESENLSNSDIYAIYFLKTIDGSDRPSEENKAEILSLGLNINNTNKDKLTLKVPVHPDFATGTYYVLLTKVKNGQIVAEKWVRTSAGDIDNFAVIQAGYRPKIKSIWKPAGPSTGEDVEIKAEYVLSLNIPDLLCDGEWLSTNLPSVINQAGKEFLSLHYDNKYQGGTATYKLKTIAGIDRKVNITIGKPATFVLKSDGTPDIFKSSVDRIMIHTAAVNDAEENPKRDVLIEMTTTITLDDGSVYEFRQVVREVDGYEYIPSSYTPIIDSITPEILHVQKFGARYKMKDETLISVKGDKFFVDRVIVGEEVVTHMPSVFFKKDGGNTSEQKYQLAFLPNAEWTDSGTGTVYRGLIYYKDVEDGTATLLMDGGLPVRFEMIVLDADGNVVDGKGGNDLGQNIILKIPSAVVIKDIGTKNLMISNPIREEPDWRKFGFNAMRSDFVEFITTNDVPRIEKVEPGIVTVEGGTEVVVTGANISPAARMYLDGTEVTGITPELNPTGDKILIRFTAPKGREGVTQILIQNPSGGIAVANFTYIDSFDKDPKFIDFSPKEGTHGTLVVVQGDNFLKPDPTVVTETGVDAFRLIGTRMTIDGRTVDDYNMNNVGEIVFKPYTAPNAEPLIGEDAGLSVYSKLYQNTLVTDGAGKVAALECDGDGRPMIVAADWAYRILYDQNTSSFHAYGKDDRDAGAVTIQFAPDADPRKGKTTIAIAGGSGMPAATFTAHMDNHVFRVGREEDGDKRVYLANYINSVTFKSAGDPPERLTLSYNFAGDAILGNGNDKEYKLVVNTGADSAVHPVKAVDKLGNPYNVSPTTNGLNLAGTDYAMITPYKASDKGVIVGHRSILVSKDQMIFEVPVLTTGRGYKDLVIINPDTKSASKEGEEGFYYIPQASTKPNISTVFPRRGSVDGGYYVTIAGSEFSDDATVYIDGQKIPVEDRHISIDGREIVVKMVKSYRVDFMKELKIDEITVPVVVVNPDGGTASKRDGFVYIIPKSAPVITRILPVEGTSNGNQVVEINGYEFRFYEPYENLVGDEGFQVGDKVQDIFQNNKWDNLLASSVKNDLETMKSLLDAGNTSHSLFSVSPIVPKKLYRNLFYKYWYSSKVLPKVYFGEKEAKIVEYEEGYLKVITPSHEAGTVEVYVINNDSGVSNKVRYTYKATSPVIDDVIPNFGKRGGSEPKEVFGKKMYPSAVFGYKEDGLNPIGNPIRLDELPDSQRVSALVRFGEIDNTKIPRVEPNGGLINNQRTTVSLEGGLTVQYYGDQNKVKMTIAERNTVYTREFTYDPSNLPDGVSAVCLPAGALKNDQGEYYVPTGLIDFTEYTQNPTEYKQAYEYVKIYIKDRRLFVERGYAPRVIYDNENHVTVYTPSYYTIGKVSMTYYNPDGGKISTSFDYTNPASVPKIKMIEPHVLDHEKQNYLVESSVLGGIDIEIIGLDFRPNISVSIGGKSAVVKELTTKELDGKKYDLVIVTVPKGATEEIDRRYPIIVSNEDSGLATSNNKKDLIGPNHTPVGGAPETLPFYFVYKKPLSFPSIQKVMPQYTSIAGGNPMVITGADFRKGAYVIIGTRAGIPIYDGVISELGTKMTLKTPLNMTLGKKDVQVLNTDYGTGILKDAITVVSAPKVAADIVGENGNPLSIIDVSGGQKIRLKGSGFMKGATVFFGGEWTKAKQNPDNIPGADEGLFTDDALYYVKDGVKATAVEFVDENTLIVTTPKVTKEGKVSVVVLNADGGISDDSVTLNYRVPIPGKPLGLKATVVDDRYIKLYDYVSERSEYFEIYAYIGRKSSTDLLANAYQDFMYLGVTDVEPYKILELPGWDKMHTGDRIVFVVRAVNKFGQSEFSNFASIQQHQLKDVKQLGPEDVDGDVGVPEGKDYDIVRNKGKITVRMAKKLNEFSPLIDLSQELHTKERQVSVPEELVRDSSAFISVIFPKSMISFSPSVLSTPAFNELDRYYYAYGNIKEEEKPAPSFMVRGRKEVTPVYYLGFFVSSNEEVLGQRVLSGNIDYSIRIPDVQNKNALEMYRFNELSGKYERIPAVVDTVNGFVTARDRQSGYYLLAEPR